MKNNDRYFRSQDFYQSVFLFSKGLTLVNVDKISNPKRATFVFADAPERELLLQSFNFAKENDSTVMVDARKLFTATRSLKEKLYSDF